MVKKYHHNTDSLKIMFYGFQKLPNCEAVQILMHQYIVEPKIGNSLKDHIIFAMKK